MMPSGNPDTGSEPEPRAPRREAMKKRLRRKLFNKRWDAHMATLTTAEQFEFMVGCLNRLAGFPHGEGWVSTYRERNSPRSSLS